MIAQIKREYGINIMKLDRIKANNFHFHYILTTYDNKKYFLRYCEDQKDLAKDIYTILKIHEHLSFKKTPVSKVVQTLSGKLTVMIENQIFCLFEYIDKKQPPTGYDYYQTGKLLGRIHKELIDVYENKMEEKVNSILNLLKLEYTHKELPKDIEKIYLFVDSYIQKHNLIEKLDVLPKQLLHGDYHNNNILYDGCNYHVIDFFNLTLDPKVFDIADVILVIEQEENKIEFLKGYTTINEITKYELDNIENAYILKNFLFFKRLISNYSINIRLYGSRKMEERLIKTFRQYVEGL